MNFFISYHPDIWKLNSSLYLFQGYESIKSDNNTEIIALALKIANVWTKKRK